MEPSDETSVGVIHGIVPAVVWRDGRWLSVPGLFVDEFFVGFAGENAEGKAGVLFAEQSTDEVADDELVVAEKGDGLSFLGLVALLGKPGFDGFAGEGLGTRDSGLGTRGRNHF